MADNKSDDTEKTEEPTQKRIEDARKKGDVAKSQEVNTWFVMIGITLLIALFSGDAAVKLKNLLVRFLEDADSIPMDGDNILFLITNTGTSVLVILMVPFLVLIVSAIAGNVFQNPPNISAEQLKPKLNKISPAAGVKRLFSSTSLVNFIIGLAKLAIVSIMMFFIVWPERDRLDPMVMSDIVNLLPVLRDMSVNLLVGVISVLTVIAAADFLYQRQKWTKKQRMTFQEVKDEHKQMEGDPVIKGKLRQLRQERSRKRMMASVPDASVVITNPTHYAIALKYEKGMGAPVCLAKGIDSIAFKIREIAEEHDIPVVENPPLARALYATVDIDGEIDSEHYKAVAQVIGYVMDIRGRLQRKNKLRIDSD